MTIVLAPDESIDLHLHTHYSDGKWMAAELLDFLIDKQFSLAAITDHNRVDKVQEIQELALQKGIALLSAVEMSAMWRGQPTDFLCYGFDPKQNQLDALAQDTTRRQHENSRQVFGYLQSVGYAVEQEQLEAVLAKPAALQLSELLTIARKHIQEETAVRRTLQEGGLAYMTQEPATIVEAAHKSDAICILAHPGRSGNFVCYDNIFLDALRLEANIDGIEVYYPLHSPEQTALYFEYAAQHNLLVSCGSDSHGLDNPPVKYPAARSRQLLERLGVEVR